MKRKVLGSATIIAAMLVLTVSTVARAQNVSAGRASQVYKFSGVIDAYTSQGTPGPYEIHGPWSLTVDRDSAKATFSAAVNMELSDGWVLTQGNGNFDANARGAHTHHITFLNGDATQTATGFQVKGLATITSNGNPAPISPSPLTIEITGGTDVEFSNITLTFDPPGSKHFGTEPITGVVRSVKQVR